MDGQRSRYPEMAGKVAVVTGGSSGIGLAVAHLLVREGVSVVLASRRRGRAEAALRTFSADAPVSWQPCDVAKPKSVAALIEVVLERHGRLDYAFNNGGSGGATAPIGEMAETDWRRTIDGFLNSVFLCMRHEIPAMIAGGGGVIVNNASVDGLRGYPFPGGAAYAAAKHGVLGLTKSAALEYIRRGVRIVAVCPGWVDTPPVTRAMKAMPDVASEILRQTPRGRIGAPEEIAEGVVWLLSDAGSFAVGTPLVLDGGYMA